MILQRGVWEVSPPLPGRVVTAYIKRPELVVRPFGLFLPLPLLVFRLPACFSVCFTFVRFDRHIRLHLRMQWVESAEAPDRRVIIIGLLRSGGERGTETRHAVKIEKRSQRSPHVLHVMFAAL